MCLFHVYPCIVVYVFVSCVHMYIGVCLCLFHVYTCIVMYVYVSCVHMYSGVCVCFMCTCV